MYLDNATESDYKICLCETAHEILTVLRDKNFNLRDREEIENLKVTIEELMSDLEYYHEKVK